MDNTADVTMTGEATNNYFGRAVSCAGDVNGDGYSDVIVGEPAYSSYTGKAYVYFGGTFLDNNPDVTLTGEAAGSAFGHSVSSAGDINGDGYSDVIVSAYLVFLIHGQSICIFRRFQYEQCCGYDNDRRGGDQLF
ncbi:MAG: FG-GAP repeat protein [Ignavibacteria bacterium]|nr:FG-GAP repeat protein [Ignavibacteria bacterium]